MDTIKGMDSRLLGKDRRGVSMPFRILSLVIILPGLLFADNFQLRIMHTNDVHARVLQIDDFDQSCDKSEYLAGVCYGGVARRMTKLKELRAEVKHSLLLDGGDQFQGTSFFNKYKGKEAQIFMNLLRYDAMAVGNHEFDEGPDTLADFIEDTQFPVLSSNIDASKHEKLKGLLKPYSVILVDGEKIGIVGYTTEDTAFISRPGDDVQFRQIEASVQASVQALRKQGVNKIIAVSHAGYGRDMQVAKQVDGIDVIVGGHTNTYLSNVDDKAEGPYPTVVNSPSGTPTLVLSAYAYGKYLGKLDVEFDEQGRVASWSGEPILLDQSVAEDAEAKAIADKLHKPIKASDEQIVAFLSRDLDGSVAACRFNQCGMGTLTADAILHKSKIDGGTAALMNGGGIRASLAAGDVTEGHLQTVFPFDNMVSTLTMKGRDLLDTLEFGVSAADFTGNEGTGRFLQVAGLKYKWSSKNEIGGRILSAEIKSQMGRFLPVDPNSYYRIATNDFMANGGDGYAIFNEKGTNRVDGSTTIRDAVADFLNLTPESIANPGVRIERVD